MPLLTRIHDDLSRRLPTLIRLWRRQAKSDWQHAPADRLEPAEAKSVAAGILRLSAGLTRERKLAGEFYFSDPALAGAYLLYFWPVSYVQARLALALLPEPPVSVLDLGGGAGPLTAAAADVGARRAVLADRSAKALEWAAALLNESQLSLTTVPRDLSRPFNWPEGPFSLVSFQHALNELWPDESGRDAKLAELAAEAAAHTEAAGHLLLLEPALKITSQTVLRIRDRLCQQGWQPSFPCLHHHDCPALQADDSCHAEADWPAPEWLQDLIQRAGLHKRQLKMTLVLLARTDGSEAPDNRYLIVSDPRRAKTRQIFVTACGSQGRIDLALRPQDAQEHNRVLFKLKPGDIVEITGAVPAATGLKLTAESRVTRLDSASPGLKILAG